MTLPQHTSYRMIDCTYVANQQSSDIDDREEEYETIECSIDKRRSRRRFNQTSQLEQSTRRAKLLCARWSNDRSIIKRDFDSLLMIKTCIYPSHSRTCIRPVWLGYKNRFPISTSTHLAQVDRSIWETPMPRWLNMCRSIIPQNSQQKMTKAHYSQSQSFNARPREIELLKSELRGLLLEKHLAFLHKAHRITGFGPLTSGVQARPVS